MCLPILFLNYWPWPWPIFKKETKNKIVQTDLVMHDYTDKDGEEWNNLLWVKPTYDLNEEFTEESSEEFAEELTKESAEKLPDNSLKNYIFDMP